MTGEVLWTSAQAAQATGGENTRDWTARGVSIDSRGLEAGDLFIALEGPNFDGHDFIAAAMEKGAAAAVSHRRPGARGPSELPAGAPLLLVEDTMDALRRLGDTARRRSEARFIGVTGSVGKTSTKEALATCLRAQAPTCNSRGSLNNHWGLPLSLARVPAGARFAVLELGMNYPGEIRDLARLLRPQVALITNVEAVHLGYFPSVEDIADAKAEIFEGMTPDDTAVLNRDNPYFGRLAARATAAGVERVVGFGRDPEAEIRLLEAIPTANGSKVRIAFPDQCLEYGLSLPGNHWVMNSLAVLATAWAAGADPNLAAREMDRLEPIKGRGERHRIRLAGGAFELIDDSYNANPSSMRAAFEVLGLGEVGRAGRRIAVLGDMLELGARSAELHEALAESLHAEGVDLVFTCGPAMASLDGALPSGLRGGHASDSNALIPLVTASVAEEDVVLVKGSAGSRMGLVSEALKGLARDLPPAANCD